VKGQDLRGITWERDVESDGVEIHHVSSGPLEVNGINYTVLPEGAQAYRDKRMRRITKGCWSHFVKYHPETRWFLRGFHDMFVNVSNLLKMIKELEEKYDPMSEWVSRYGCGSFFGLDYAHGSTGHFFSNFAVKTLANNTAIFDNCPRRWNEDSCLHFVMDKLKLPFYESCSTKFIISFPEDIGELKVKKICPSYNLWGVRPSKITTGHTPVIEAVALHMHHIPMDFWRDWINRTMALNLSIIWKWRARFCTPAQ
jgi:hypothetical protein